MATKKRRQFSRFGAWADLIFGDGWLMPGILAALGFWKAGDLMWHALRALQQNIGLHDTIQWAAHPRGGWVIYSQSGLSLFIESGVWLLGGIGVLLIAFWYNKRR